MKFIQKWKMEYNPPRGILTRYINIALSENFFFLFYCFKILFQCFEWRYIWQCWCCQLQHYLLLLEFVSVFLQTSPLRYIIYCHTTFLWLLSLHKKWSFPLRTGSYFIKTAASVHKYSIKFWLIFLSLILIKGIYT